MSSCMVQGWPQSHVGGRLREYRAGGAAAGAGASSESDSSDDTRSAALSATRAYSSVSMLLQKWIAYLGILKNSLSIVWLLGYLVTNS